MKKRDKREARKVSARNRAEKHSSGFDRTSLALPDGAETFSIKDAGTYRIDILPYTVKGDHNPWAEDGDLHFERTYWTHRGIGPNNDTYVCLNKTFGKKCPICEERARLLSGDEDSSQAAKDLAPKERQLFNVIELDEKGRRKDGGVKIWDISYHLFGKQLDNMVKNGDDGEYDLFADLQEGKTLKLNVEKVSIGAGNPFSSVEGIEFKARKEQYDEDILEEVYCLDDLVKETPYDKLKAIFLQVGDTDDEEDEDDEPKRGKAKAKGGKKAKPVDDDEDDEDEDDDLDEDEDDEPKKGKQAAKGAGPAGKMGLKVGMTVEHEDFGTCEIVKISGDGTSLTLEDEDGDEHKAVAPKECSLPDDEDDDEEEDDTPKSRRGKPAAKGKGKGKSSKDDDDDDDDDDEDEDEDEDDDD